MPVNQSIKFQDFTSFRENQCHHLQSTSRVHQIYACEMFIVLPDIKLNVESISIDDVCLQFHKLIL